MRGFYVKGPRTRHIHLELAGWALAVAEDGCLV